MLPFISQILGARRYSALAILAIAGLLLTIGRISLAADASPSGWKLVWNDEFDGPEIDRTKWDFDLGNGFFNYEAQQWIGGWGNNELQYYTDEPSNAFVADGHLHIRALKESLHGCGYTSARLKSRGRDGKPLFHQTYGRFEFRAKFPTGKGVWPALWMMPQDEAYGGWASSGEIDIVEARGQEPHKVLGTLHYGSRWPANTHVSQDYFLPAKQSIAEFHTYVLEWTPGEIRWLVDDHEFSKLSFWWSSSQADGDRGRTPTKEADLNPWPAPFDKPFYLIMNLAVGGEFLGPPDKSTPFPAEMLVDYVRAYEKIGGYGAVAPRSAGKLPFAP